MSCAVGASRESSESVWNICTRRIDGAMGGRIGGEVHLLAGSCWASFASSVA